MISDQAAYSGLSWYNSRKLTGMRVHVNSEDVDTIFQEGTPGAVVGIVIAPTAISFRSYCYKMLISAETHELYYYGRTKYKGSKDALFSKAEIRQFERRNGIIPL